MIPSDVYVQKEYKLKDQHVEAKTHRNAPEAIQTASVFHWKSCKDIQENPKHAP